MKLFFLLSRNHLQVTIHKMSGVPIGRINLEDWDELMEQDGMQKLPQDVLTLCEVLFPDPVKAVEKSDTNTKGLCDVIRKNLCSICKYFDKDKTGWCNKKLTYIEPEYIGCSDAEPESDTYDKPRPGRPLSEVLMGVDVKPGQVIFTSCPECMDLKEINCQNCRNNTGHCGMNEGCLFICRECGKQRSFK